MMIDPVSIVGIVGILVMLAVFILVFFFGTQGRRR
jgi:hypothetical protein